MLPADITRWILPALTIVVLAFIIFRGKPLTESYSTWSRDLQVNKCRGDQFGEIGAVLMPAGHADHTPWFDYSSQYNDGVRERSCDDCPGPAICPECPNHGVSLAVGAAPPGPLSLGADPAVYEHLHAEEQLCADELRSDDHSSDHLPADLHERYTGPILAAGVFSGMVSGMTNAIGTELIQNYKTIAENTRRTAARLSGMENMTGERSSVVGSDGGYTRGYGAVCFGAPDNMSQAAVAELQSPSERSSPSVRAASIGGINQSNNTGYTVMNTLSEHFADHSVLPGEPGPDYYRKKAIGGLEYDTTPNYASSLDADYITSRESMGACTTRKPISRSLPKISTTYDEFGKTSYDNDATVTRALRRGACNSIGYGSCALGFVSRNSARKPELDRTSSKVDSRVADYLYTEATQLGSADITPAADACTFWGAYGRPYYEQC